MAALPSPTQVAGGHAAVFEAYYKQVDPCGQGEIEAIQAARFLKKSDLSDIILGKIWDMADPQSRGYLDKPGMFVALKLCAVAQAGHTLNIANLSLDLPPPKMGEIPKAPKKVATIVSQPQVNNASHSVVISNRDWSIKPSEQIKYEQLFDNLLPINGYIQGNKVKGVLMNSKLPLDTLGKIWDLADMDKDGMLDRYEFIVAMHLVYKALENYTIPSVLPPELVLPHERTDMSSISKSPAPATVVSPIITSHSNISAVKSLTGVDKEKLNDQQWVISHEDQLAANELFLKADMDMDGFVSGAEIKDVFLQSKLPQAVLADIWSLCDICQSGKLNKEQFALAMWLIKQKLRNNEIPTNLPSEMVPPSLRKINDGVVENNKMSGYANPELNIINDDIAELAHERHILEQDIAQKEADIKIKNGEIKSLQSELDTLAATLKQLENQKGEAQKRLHDLKTQVDKLHQQAEEQESVLRLQEEELNTKRQELEGLRQEEFQLDEQQNCSRDQLNDLTKTLQITELHISEANVKISYLEEQHRHMSDAMVLYDSAFAAGDASIVPDASLQFKPDIGDIDYSDNQNHNSVELNETLIHREQLYPDRNVRGFSDRDPFTANNINDSFSSKDDPFGLFFPSQDSVISQDPFGDDPFAALHAPVRAESPSPALPPKKAKQPPPRPAPPRPSAGPFVPFRAAPAPPSPSPIPGLFSTANSDPFSDQQSDNSNGNTFIDSEFANFANFDSKPVQFPSCAISPRPFSSTQLQTTTTIQFSNLPDFTEDPFRDYRYDDPFVMRDPFTDDIIKDSNGSKHGPSSDFQSTTPSTRIDTSASAFYFDSSKTSSFILGFADFNKNIKQTDTDFAYNANHFVSKMTEVDDNLFCQNDNSLQSDFILLPSLKGQLHLEDTKITDKKLVGNKKSRNMASEEQITLEKAARAVEEVHRQPIAVEAGLNLALNKNICESDVQ